MALIRLTCSPWFSIQSSTWIRNSKLSSNIIVYLLKSPFTPSAFSFQILDYLRSNDKYIQEPFQRNHRLNIYIYNVHNHGIFVSLPTIVCYFNGQGCFPYARGTVASDVRVTCPCWGPVRGKFRQATWPWTGYMRATNWRRPTDYCNELAKATPMSRLSDSEFENWQTCECPAEHLRVHYSVVIT